MMKMCACFTAMIVLDIVIDVYFFCLDVIFFV